MIIRYLKIIILHIILGICYAFFYAHLTIPHFNEVNIKMKDVRNQVYFTLPDNNTYLLKIWGDFSVDRVLLNGTQIAHVMYKPRKVLKEYYFVLPPELAKTGNNSITIEPDKRSTIRIKNNIVISELGAILFKNTPVNKLLPDQQLYLLFVLLFILLGFAFLYFFENFIGIPFDKFLAIHFCAFLPCLLLMGILYESNKYLPIKLLFFNKSFFGFCFLFIFIFYLPLLFSYLWRQLKKLGHKINDLELKDKFFCLFFVQWWLSLKIVKKFEFSFYALLFLCAILLYFKLEFVAEIFGNIAYFLIFAAVILVLLKMQKEKHENRQ